MEGKRWGECVATDWMREMELIIWTSSTLASLLVNASHRQRQHGGGGSVLTALSPMAVATIARDAGYSRGNVTETRLRESIGRLQLGCNPDSSTREVPRPTFTVLALGGWAARSPPMDPTRRCSRGGSRPRCQPSTSWC